MTKLTDPGWEICFLVSYNRAEKNLRLTLFEINVLSNLSNKNSFLVYYSSSELNFVVTSASAKRVEKIVLFSLLKSW